MKSTFGSIRRRLLSCLFIPAILGTTLLGRSETVTVPGTANLWLAGMPDGSTAFLGSAFDTAPGQSPIMVPLGFTPGSLLSFRASGSVCTVGALGFFGPDGDPRFGYRRSQNGISGTTNSLSALVGIFLGADRPDLTPAPSDTMFLLAPWGQQDYTLLSPQLKQIFFIGDGWTSSGVQQQVMVPAGATRLFLGVSDLHSLSGDNAGSFNVFVTVPEPGTWSLALVAAASLAAWRALGRRRV